VSRTVYVQSERSRYVQNISIGPHILQGDEPSKVGGSDAGPDPYELLLASLGACTGITLRIFADRRQWPLEGVRISLSHAKVHAEDCAACDTEIRMVDRIDMEVSFLGELSEDQRQKLMEIASKCPVHRTLTSEIQICARLIADSAPPR
jgi:uncharacterized OsmC-like protein